MLLSQAAAEDLFVFDLAKHTLHNLNLIISI